MTADNDDDDDYETFVCERCGIQTTRLKMHSDGFNVCLECRWYDERPWIPRKKDADAHDK